MFAKIMVPNDGSAMGSMAALQGIEFAAQMGAEVIGVHVARELQNPAFKFAGKGSRVSMPPAEYESSAKEASVKILQPLVEAAARNSVKFTGISAISNQAAKVIVRNAEEFGCELIFIGTNGCAGWSKALMGSVTNKVLATTRIPVLTFRLPKAETPEKMERYKFSKILVPNDGSVVGSKAALQGIEFAAKLGAEVVSVHVARELQNPAFNFAAMGSKINMTQTDYETSAKEASATILQPVAEAAKQAGVKFTPVSAISNHPAQVIVRTAEEQGCGLIFIGTNGCAGWDDILMGSVTNKVLATTSIPVLAYRLPEAEVPGSSDHYESAFPC